MAPERRLVPIGLPDPASFVGISKLPGRLSLSRPRQRPLWEMLAATWGLSRWMMAPAFWRTSATANGSTVGEVRWGSRPARESGELGE